MINTSKQYAMQSFTLELELLWGASLVIVLHGEVVSFDVNTLIYTVQFDREDNADPQHYKEDELQKIIFKPVVGIESIEFVPYTGMLVFAYRGEI